VGHSQGTTQMFYALTQMEEEFLQSRVNLFVAMAPVVRLKNCQNKLFKNAAKQKTMFENTLKRKNIYEIFGNAWNDYSKVLHVAFPWLSEMMI
jgi:hypothetical protein